jgi:hypothetical protein
MQIKKLSSIFLAGLLAACATPDTTIDMAGQLATVEPADKSTLYVALAPEATIEFRGELELDEQHGHHGSPLYAGDAATVFLGAIFIHAAVQHGVNQQEEKRRRKEADRVLNEYESTLDSITIVDLLASSTGADHDTISKVIHADELPGAKNVIMVSVAPTYTFSQNQKTIALQAELVFQESLRPEESQGSVRVEYIASYAPQTIAGEGHQMKDLVNVLSSSLISALNLGFARMEGSLTESSAEETIRYEEAGEKRVERGFVISQSCERLIFASLRSEIKSVPVFEPSVGCES